MNSAIYIDIGKALIEGCVIDSSRSGIECGGGSDVTVIDCTIQNCNAYSDGGAIRLENSTASITNCTMSNNSAPNRGGAVYAENSSIIMTDCDISSNQASDGGGIWLSNSEMVVQSCDVEGNNADDDGGGIYASGSTNDLTVYDSTIVTNFAANESGGNGTDDGGGGICMLGGELELIQSSVSSNSTIGNAGGLLSKNASVWILHSTVQANASAYLAGGIYSQGSLEIIGSKVCANSLSQIVGAHVDTGGNYIDTNCDNQVGACCVESPDLGELCLFADSSGCSTLGGQWHGAGTSCTTDSPCAIELVPCSADVTGDWKVDVFDIIFLLDSWGNSSGTEDINDDGAVNVVDLILLLENWGDCEIQILP
jgi:predicted outer membrane repeat protein